MLADRFAPAVASGPALSRLLARFNEAGVLVAADVHVAGALARLGGDGDEQVALAAALAVRAPRRGHVLVDLDTVAGTAMGEADEDIGTLGLPWPDPGPWIERLARSPLVAVGDAGPEDRPLRLVGNALYLDRFWRDERLVAGELLARGQPELPLDDGALSAALVRLFPDDPGGLQCQAAANAARRRFSVIAGGPGTGKTTTVARLLALLDELASAAGHPPPLVALAAPTGKAASRMAEAVHDEVRRLEVDEAVRQRLLALDGSTVHRLLGRHPAGANRFRHDRHNKLPHDVVVVDETSMMSLPLMARLVEAVRPEARLVLLGDQQQLASVEAGAVLGDIVGPAAELAAPGGLTSGGPTSGGLTPGGLTPGGLTSGPATPAPRPPTRPARPGVAACITVLQANHRFRGPLADLAGAVRAGDEDASVAVLSGRGRAEGSGSTVTWLPVDVATAGEEALAPVRAVVLAAWQQLLGAALGGDGPGALEALGRLRLLCAHRDGPAGASTWNAHVEQWLLGGAGDAPTPGAWYVGRPVIVSENDYSLGLFNGDVGAVVAKADGGLTVAFRRGGGVAVVSPSRVPAVSTAFAMTAHRAQGSEFDEVVVLLPPAQSRILTRELLYTAITRARRSVVVVGPEASVRAAVSRPVARASGLTARLWR